MHKEILTEEQEKLLPLVATFSKEFGMVGGTAVALQIGHRRSIDFDLFSYKKFGNQSLLNRIVRSNKGKGPDRVIVNKLDELTFILNDVKFTFFHYPYQIDYAVKLPNVMKMPDLLTLAAMKAFAMGQRNKWKDYVDLYFIIKDHHSLKEIIGRTNQLFGSGFNEVLFRAQLGYFSDVSYAEPVKYMPGFEIVDADVEKELVKFSLEQ